MAWRICPPAGACAPFGSGGSTEAAHPGPAPPLALDAHEQQQQLLDALNSGRFADTAPAAVHATLLGEGTYLGSVHTMYRVLAANDVCHERLNQLTHPTYTKPELLAVQLNQVWSWDITKLPWRVRLSIQPPLRSGGLGRAPTSGSLPYQGDPAAGDSAGGSLFPIR